MKDTALYDGPVTDRRPATVPQGPPVVVVPVPDGFGQEDALKRLARLVISQLETGMSERDIAKRLHGHIEREGGI